MKELWPGWETVKAVGTGGFSKVYKIRKKGSEDAEEYTAALKIISIPQSPDEYETYVMDGYDDKAITDIFTSQVKRITEEFRLMAQFKGNSNIVSYEDHMIVPHEDGRGWDILIRMELLTSLPKCCNQSMLTEEETVKVGIGICRALELCQKQNIIHRDIKPQNIFVSRFGDYKLGDFGIAKSMDHATHATKTGTYSYMAPEVYHGEEYGSTIDLYSLGLVLYWLLNERRLPFLSLPPNVPTALQINEAQARRLSGEALPAPKNGSEELKNIVLKACAYKVTDRYASPVVMRHDLEKVLLAIEDVAEKAKEAEKEPIEAWDTEKVGEVEADSYEKTVGFFDYYTPAVHSDNVANKESEKTEAPFKNLNEEAVEYVHRATEPDESGSLNGNTVNTSAKREPEVKDFEYVEYEKTEGLFSSAEHSMMAEEDKKSEENKNDEKENIGLVSMPQVNSSTRDKEPVLKKKNAKVKEPKQKQKSTKVKEPKTKKQSAKVKKPSIEFRANPTIMPARRKSKIKAGILAICGGWLGVDKLYLGRTVLGCCIVALLFVTNGLFNKYVSIDAVPRTVYYFTRPVYFFMIVGIIRGIYYLSMSDQKWNELLVKLETKKKKR